MKVKMNKKFSYLVIVITAILVISMPVPNGNLIANDESQPEVRTSNGAYKAALMIGGDETDLGFSWVAIQGMYDLRDKYNWSISISRQVAFPDQYDVANNYGAAGYDVVFMVGGQFIETSYFSGLPDKWNQTVWVQIPGLNFSHKENLVGLHPNFQTEGHYLAGVLSGLMTETDNIGVIFGEWYEYLSMEFYAFKAGVESVNSVACVHGRVAGTWGDAALGKQITKALIEAKNVDIVVQVADTTGRGVIAAAIEAGIAIIGTVGDQYSLAPLNTMTSIGMNTSIVMDYVVSNIENLTPYNLYYASLNMTEVGGFLFPYHHYDSIIPQSVKDQVDNAKAGIANGTIKVPEIWNDDAGPEAPTDCPTPPAPEIPGFPFLGIAFATMLGVVVLLVTKKRIIPNKHKS